MVEVIFNKNVSDYLNKLANKLYKKDYFSFIEYADKYVKYIVYDILNNIQYKTHYQTKPQHKKYGTYYIIIITNKRTAFHVYFDKKDNRCLIKKIENNHLPSAKFLNEL